MAADLRGLIFNAAEKAMTFFISATIRENPRQKIDEQ
jgi:hypothetical protein